MAQRVEIILEDDLDGTKADETVLFGLDGVEYEVDLSSENIQALHDAMAPFVAVARRTGGRRKRATASVPRSADTAGGASTSDIRVWAQENGHEVSSRGRISAEVREAYDKAHG